MGCEASSGLMLYGAQPAPILSGRTGTVCPINTGFPKAISDRPHAQIESDRADSSGIGSRASARFVRGQDWSSIRTRPCQRNSLPVSNNFGSEN